MTKLHTSTLRTINIYRDTDRKPRNSSAYGVALGLLVVCVGIVIFAIPIANSSKGSARLEGALDTFMGTLDSAAPITSSIQVDNTLIAEKRTAFPPIRIVIPSQAIDIPVVGADIVDGYWELSETMASYGRGSASPGETGNTVIFAHARHGLFLPIRNLPTGTAIYVQTEVGWHRYITTETKLVNPDQIEVIAPTADETLTLFTCSGFMDSKRQIVVAKPRG